MSGKQGYGARPARRGRRQAYRCRRGGTPEYFRPTIGYWLIPTVHGEGYGTESISLLFDFLFRVSPHPTVHAKTLPDNEAPRGVLESLGFTQEGRARKQVFWDGEYQDSIMYSLLRLEWYDED